MGTFCMLYVTAQKAGGSLSIKDGQGPSCGACGVSRVRGLARSMPPGKRVAPPTAAHPSPTAAHPPTILPCSLIATPTVAPSPQPIIACHAYRSPRPPPLISPPRSLRPPSVAPPTTSPVPPCPAHHSSLPLLLIPPTAFTTDHAHPAHCGLPHPLLRPTHRSPQLSMAPPITTRHAHHLPRLPPRVAFTIVPPLRPPPTPLTTNLVFFSF